MKRIPGERDFGMRLKESVIRVFFCARRSVMDAAKS
jgi:hypothetical protein